MEAELLEELRPKAFGIASSRGGRTGANRGLPLSMQSAASRPKRLFRRELFRVLGASRMRVPRTRSPVSPRARIC